MIAEIDALISEFKESKWKSNPMVRTMDICLNKVSLLSRLITQVIDQLPEGGTFHDAALSYLPDDCWPLVVDHAIKALECAKLKNVAAEAVIAYASLQCPRKLHQTAGKFLLLRQIQRRITASFPGENPARLISTHCEKHSKTYRLVLKLGNVR